MTKKMIFLSLVSSIIGGAIVLTASIFLNEDKFPSYIQSTGNSQPVMNTSFVFDSADYVVPEGLNFVFAAKKSTPSVVHIRTSYKTEEKNSISHLFRDYHGDNSDSPLYKIPSGIGSGVIISADGYIVTNNHVIDQSNEITVLLNDNRTYSATIIGTDKSTDLAVIKIDAENLPTIIFGDSDKISIGEWVLAIGNPYEFRSTVTAGIISAKGRNINILSGDYRIESFIQTDAAVNPGNSGGALVNLKGELVGINTAIASRSGAFAGYSFAVPVSLVNKVMKDLIEYGAVQRALLGIRIQDVNAQLAEDNDLNTLNGVYVSAIESEGSASKAGIISGDVIIAIDEKTVKSVAELQEQIAVKRPGDKVTVKYLRDGNINFTEAILRNISGDMEVVKATNNFLNRGAIFNEVSDKLKGELKIDGGIQITDLNDGIWKDSGIKEGFVIIRIDRRRIDSINDLKNYISQKRGDGILIEGFYPDGTKVYYGIGL